MKVDLGIWSWLTQAVVVLVAIAIIILIGLTYLPLIKQNERYRERILQLETQIKIEEKTSADLATQLDALRNDPKTIERLARETLSYAKSNETIIHFEAPETNGSAH
jgi:cell division protein FtsB